MKSAFDMFCLIVCLLTALALRLAVIFGQSEQLAIDRDAYLGIATGIAEGRGYSSPNSTTATAFRPPVYPLTLAAGFYLFPGYPVVAEVNLVTGLLTVLLTLSLGKYLNLGRMRYVAGMLVAVDPVLLQYTARPMTESLCTFLAVLWMRTAMGSSSQESRAKCTTDNGCESQIAVPNNHSTGEPPTDATSDCGATAVASEIPPTGRVLHDLVWGIGVGLAFGLLVLCRPTFWAIAGVCCLFLLADLRCRANGRSASAFWSRVGSLLGTAITVGPWLIRNSIVLGVPILTTTHGGYTLLLGNNPVFDREVVQQPWGTIWTDASLRAWEADRLSRFQRELGSRATEVEEDAWNSREAKAYMIANPWRCSQAIVHRVRSLWNTGPQAEAVDGVNKRVLTAMHCFYAVFLTLGFLGMALVWNRRDRSRWMLLYVLIVSVQLVHLIYWTNTRMRAPLTPAIALFAAAAVSRIRDVCLSSRTPRG